LSGACAPDDGGDRGLEVGRLQHAAAPAAEQRLHAVEHLGIVVDAQHRDAGELAAVGSGGSRAACARRRGGRQRHLDREARAALRTERKSTLWSSTRAMRSTIDRPSPRPRATLAPSSSRWNSRKITAFSTRDAEPGVVDVDAQLAAPAAADQHAALGRVLDGVGDEVLQQPAQQAAVRAHGQRARHEGELEIPFRAQAARTRPRAGAKSRRCGSSNSGFMAPVSSREMSSSAPNISSTASSEASMLPTARRVLAAALARDQRGDVEPRGVERLQDVVAGGGEEAGLGDVGLLGLGLGAAELGVEARQLGGALAHAHFQRLVGALQRLGGGDAR
jgi:hypothetical protein